MVFGGWFDEPQPKRVRPRFTPKEKEALFKLQGGKCNGCGKKFDLRNFAVDHIKPFAHGHGERLNNLQLLCTACNSLKGTGTMPQLKKKLRAQGVLKAPAKAASASKSATSKKKPTSATNTKGKATKRATTKKRQTKPSDPLEEFLNIFS